MPTVLVNNTQTKTSLVVTVIEARMQGVFIRVREVNVKTFSQKKNMQQ